MATLALTMSFVACGESDDSNETTKTKTGSTSNVEDVALTVEQRVKAASEAEKVGNWGLGNEYEVLALLSKYGCATEFLSQDFTMDGFDDGSITLASAMTYNEQIGRAHV